MIKRLKIILLLTLSFGLFVACDDDDTTKPTDNTQTSDLDKLLPSDTDNWWKYEKIEYDADGVPMDDTKETDSTHLIGTVQKEGKTALAFVKHNLTKGSVDTTFFYKENGKLYTLFLDLFNLAFLIPGNPPNEWVVLVETDPTITDWHVYDHKLENFVDPNKPGLIYNADLDVHAYRLANESTRFLNRDITLEPYNLHFTMEIEQIIGTDTIADVIEYDHTYLFHKEVGLFMERTSSIPISFGTFEYTLPATIRKCFNYYVK